VRSDDRSRRGADEAVALTQVKPRGVLEPGQDARYPRLAEDAPAAEDEDVGEGEHGRQRTRGRRIGRGVTSLSILFKILSGTRRFAEVQCAEGRPYT
jgi:hypothetical protein